MPRLFGRVVGQRRLNSRCSMTIAFAISMTVLPVAQMSTAMAVIVSAMVISSLLLLSCRVFPARQLSIIPTSHGRHKPEESSPPLLGTCLTTMSDNDDAWDHPR